MSMAQDILRMWLLAFLLMIGGYIGLRTETTYTILRAVLDRGSGSNICLETVEAECDNLIYSAMSWIMEALKGTGETYGLVTGDRR